MWWWVIKEYWLQILIVCAPVWILIFVGLHYATGQHKKGG